jgi:hypothetical protein
MDSGLGKAVSETYFLIFFKNIENTFPKPSPNEKWKGIGNRISIFLKKIRNSVSETALPNLFYPSGAKNTEGVS